jgi:hypothetical protein
VPKEETRPGNARTRLTRLIEADVSRAWAESRRYFLTIIFLTKGFPSTSSR